MFSAIYLKDLLYVSAAMTVLTATSARGQCRYEAIVIDSICPDGPTQHVNPDRLNNLGHWVGHCISAVERPVRWSKSEGIILIDNFPSDVIERGRPEGFNDLGAVAGTHEIRQSLGVRATRGYMIDGDSYVRIEPKPGFNFTEANAINMSGRVVGRWGNSAVGPATAFYYYDGIMIDLGPVLGDSSSAFDINNRNEITGYAGTGLYVDVRAFYWSESKAIILDPLPGAIQSQGRAINNFGDIVGTSSFGMPGENNGYILGTLWSDGELIDLGTLPGFTFSRAIDINDCGQIVGYVSNAYLADLTAYLWQNGQMYQLRSLINLEGEIDVYSANGINDAGQVVAEAYSEGESFIYLLNPIGRVTEDITCDCAVDQYDLILMFRAWGSNQPVADLNKDGIVDVHDLMQLLAAWSGD